MPRAFKIGIVIVAGMLILPIIAIGVLFLGVSLFDRDVSAVATREIPLANQGRLIIDGKRTGRSEHGFSQSAGYRPPGSADIEWFGDLSDGVDPGVYQAGSMLVVIDIPGATIYVRTQKKTWKNFALVFPNDLGPFPISFYAERTGLTSEEVARISDLGGKREQKWPTTYIQGFDPETRGLKCEYHVDSKSWWPLHFRLSEDGAHLALVEIGGASTCCR